MKANKAQLRKNQLGRWREKHKWNNAKGAVFTKVMTAEEWENHQKTEEEIRRWFYGDFKAETSPPQKDAK